MIQTILLKVKSNASLFLLSWFIVAFGQPARSSLLCFFSAAFGIALFWIAARRIPKHRFWWASAWYAGVQLVQLSWLTSIEYQGYYILAVYFFLCVGLGAQFGFLTYFFLAEDRFRMSRPARILAVASLWTLMEWGRLFLFCGFSWNPVGLAMAGHTYSMQFANVWGVFGLSFWVILVNALLYFVWHSHRRLLGIGMWALFALFPYFYGFVFLSAAARSPDEPSRSISVGLVQTGLLPSQKVPLPGRGDELIAPLGQWKRILSSLRKEDCRWDLLIFPEAVVPMRADFCFYPYDEVVEELKTEGGAQWLDHAPSFVLPFAQYQLLDYRRVLCVSNIFFAQMLANTYGAEVVIGLDHYDLLSRSHYNSAFHCEPQSCRVSRYDKQILLPLAEYLPFFWLRSLTKRYGITAFFSHGSQARVMGKKAAFSPSICYEETFPHLIRKGRVQGAELLVNVTNDNYYPFSQLPEQHFAHARLRAVENGVPLLRACNTGVTAVVDRFGRTVSRFGGDDKKFEFLHGVLSVTVPLESHRTLYLFWGNAGIISLALFILFCLLAKLNLKKMDL